MKKSFQDIINSSVYVLVDFHATWCGPCKTMAPILESFKSEKGSEVSIIKIDVDKNQGISTSYNITGVPTLILFKNGKSIWRKSGVVPLHELRTLIP